jgi:hypothetical protein
MFRSTPQANVTRLAQMRARSGCAIINYLRDQSRLLFSHFRFPKIKRDLVLASCRKQTRTTHGLGQVGIAQMIHNHVRGISFALHALKNVQNICYSYPGKYSSPTLSLGAQDARTTLAR